MRVPIPTLRHLADDDRKAVGLALQSSVEKARGQDRMALARAFAALTEVIASGTNPPDVLIETAADLDEDEVAAVIDGLEVRRAREQASGLAGRAALYRDLAAGFGEERLRRRNVLDALDQAMSWYETNPLPRR